MSKQPTRMALTLLALLCAAAAATSERWTTFDRAPQAAVVGWSDMGAAADDEQFTMIVMLHVGQPEELERKFWEISDPQSPSWRQHLSLEQLTELTASDEQAVAALHAWAGSQLTVELSPTRDMAVVRGRVAAASARLRAPLRRFKHAKTGLVAIRAAPGASVQLPAALAQHVALLGGVTSLPATVHHSRTHSAAIGGAMMSALADAASDGPLAQASSSAGAPTLVFAAGGSQQIALAYSPSCLNGQPVSNLTAPCASDVALTGLQLVVTPGAASSVTVDVPVGSCSLRAGTVLCLTTTPVMAQLQNYVQTQLFASATFANGSSSEPVQYTFNGGAKSGVWPGRFTTPTLLRDAYNVPSGLTVTNVKTRVAVAEFLQQFYSPVDLDDFLHSVGLPAQAVHMQASTEANNATNPGGEASLDIQYLLGVAPGATPFFQSNGGAPTAAVEPYLTWLAQLNKLSTTELPNIISISYGDLESSYTADKAKRINQEFMKQGSRGVSLIFSSGDNGVSAATGAQYCMPLHPAFPATSPYVTAVGATQWSQQSVGICQQPTGLGLLLDCSKMSEIACATDSGALISSGGGFSNIFDMPSYQKDVVQTYLSTYDQPDGGDGSVWNKKGRAFPDVAANGHNFPVFINGDIEVLDGTSAAAPTFAGIMTLVTDALHNAGHKPLGFLNPWIYQTAAKFPQAFHDITLGNNACQEGNADMVCCEHFFSARPGWDAVTGLGSPNFVVLRDAALQPKATTLEPIILKPTCPAPPSTSSLWAATIVLLALTAIVALLAGMQYARVSKLSHDTGVAFRSMDG